LGDENHWIELYFTCELSVSVPPSCLFPLLSANPAIFKVGLRIILDVHVTQGFTWLSPDFEVASVRCFRSGKLWSRIQPFMEAYKNPSFVDAALLLKGVILEIACCLSWLLCTFSPLYRVHFRWPSSIQSWAWTHPGGGASLHGQSAVEETSYSKIHKATRTVLPWSRVACIH
jgi:hypothetical protein